MSTKAEAKKESFKESVKSKSTTLSPKGPVKSTNTNKKEAKIDDKNKKSKTTSKRDNQKQQKSKPKEVKSKSESQKSKPKPKTTSKPKSNKAIKEKRDLIAKASTKSVSKEERSKPASSKSVEKRDSYKRYSALSGYERYELIENPGQSNFTTDSVDIVDKAKASEAGDGEKKESDKKEGSEEDSRKESAEGGGTTTTTTSNGINLFDEEEPEKNEPNLPCEPGMELDNEIQKLLNLVKNVIPSLSVPNVTVDIPEYYIKVFLYDGRVISVNKIRQYRPGWVFCNDDLISIGISAKLDDMRIMYKYRVIKATRLLFDGEADVKMTIRSQVQLSQAIEVSETRRQRIDRVKLNRLSKVYVMLRGLGNLSQSVSMLVSSYLNENQDELEPTFRIVERDLLSMANAELQKIPALISL